MKNLFDFATKELSQDAFLRWLFESYDDIAIKPIVYDFINFFTKDQIIEGGFQREPISISERDNVVIKTYSQCNKIDVSVDIIINDNKHFCLVIEDKTTSSEHNQLKKYNESIKAWKNQCDEGLSTNKWVYKIFYKTSQINDDGEINRVKDAKWKSFDLYSIYEFFRKFKNKTNIQILNDYIEHLEHCKSDIDNVFLPTEDNTQQWKSFFTKTVLPKLDETKYSVTISEHYYGYAYLIIKFKNGMDCPYLEFRSRDCLNGYITARILLYGQKLTGQEITNYKNKIKQTKSFFSQNNSQQIGCTTRRNQLGIKYNNQDEFVSIIKQLIDEYMSLF